MKTNNSDPARAVTIERAPIELYKLLKIDSMVTSGGEAKAVIAAGQVRVNGEVETRKRKKIRHNDIIEFRNDKIRVIAG